jgi:hypothetical protein
MPVPPLIVVVVPDTLNAHELTARLADRPEQPEVVLASSLNPV